MNYFLAYIATLIPLTILDALWILVVAKKFYAEQMGFLFTKSVNMVPVAFFYPLYALGVLLLAVLPAVSSASWVEALWRGALLGLVAYGLVLTQTKGRKFYSFLHYLWPRTIIRFLLPCFLIKIITLTDILSCRNDFLMQSSTT